VGEAVQAVQPLAARMQRDVTQVAHVPSVGLVRFVRSTGWAVRVGDGPELW
jgi:hypothetical protein